MMDGSFVHASQGTCAVYVVKNDRRSNRDSSILRELVSLKSSRSAYPSNLECVADIYLPRWIKAFFGLHPTVAACESTKDLRRSRRPRSY